MSIFNIGRPATASVGDDPADRWWNWNPARRAPVAAAPVTVAPVAVTATDPWWRWNPYRRDLQHAATQGRLQGYDKGVRDEQRAVQRRQRRRSHPIMALLVLAAAAGGVTFTGLAFENGSFAAGGAVVDQKIAEWRADILGGAAQAADKSGRAMQNAGQSISNRTQAPSPNGG